MSSKPWTEEEYERALILRHDDNKTYKEIAAILNRKQNDVNNYMQAQAAKQMFYHKPERAPYEQPITSKTADEKLAGLKKQLRYEDMR